MKTRHGILLILVLIALVQIASAQFVSQRVFSNLGGLEDYGGYGLAYFDTAADGNLIMSGGGYTSIETGGTFLLKTTRNGTPLWSKYVYTDQGPWSMTQTSDGGFLFTSTYSAGFINNTQRVLLFKTNSLGEMMWSTSTGLPAPTIDYNSINIGIGSVEKTGGNILSIAHSSPTQSYTFDVLLYESMSDGTFSWGKKLGGQASEIAIRILKVASNYYIIGRTFKNGSPANGILLIKLNSSGAVIWTKSFRTPLAYVRSAVASDDAFYIGGAGASGLLLAKIDTSGTFLWAKEYEINATQFNAETISLMNDSGVLISGYTQDFPKKSILIRTDALGDTLWTKSFGDTISHLWYNAIELNDTIVLSGTMSLDNSDKRFPILSRLSPKIDNFCIGEIPTLVNTVVSLSGPDTTFVLPEVPYGEGRSEQYTLVGTGATDSIFCEVNYTSVLENANELVFENAYPNPTTGKVTIDLSHVEGTKTVRVFSPIGALVNSFQLGSFQAVIIDLPEIKGIYLIQITTGDGLRGSLKVVKK